MLCFVFFSSGCFVVLPDVKAQANPVSTDPNAIASNIKYHADYTPSFSPYKFELKQAYVATAQSLRDTLVDRWNQTYKHFTQENAKTIHYLSMEFLQVSHCFVD
jgi:starch phosphorylase